MKVLKKIFYFLAALLLILCAGVLVCATNPSLSSSLATVLYGNDTTAGIIDTLTNKDSDSAQTDSSSSSGTTADNDASANDTDNQTADSGVSDSSTADSSNAESVPGADTTGISESVSTLPDVSSLTGYQPIESDEQQITDDAAKSIEGSLDKGETGDSLTFDELFYPFYYMLDEDEQKVYRQIYANALELNSTFAPVTDITSAELKSVFEAVVNDHPELFYLETGYSVKYTSAGKVIEITLSYYTIANDISTAKSSFESAANAVIAGASALTDDYSREKYVYDALIGMVSYDASAPMSQSAYSALVNGKTVCAGYARANQYILQQLGIPCYYCTGYSGEDHAWNIVKLSDGYYNVDVTWGDTVPATYDYFNRTDADFVSTHVRSGLSVNLPPCLGTLYRGLESGNVSTVTLPDGTNTSSSTHITPMRYDDEYGNRTETTTGATETTTGTTTGDTGSSATGDTTGTDAEHAALVAELQRLGLSESDAIWSLDDYYTDCKAKLIAAGSGDVHFVNIVPASLFNEIEKAYGNKEYQEKYVQDALKELGKENFSIQIQAQELGDKYYKLYHNVVTW